MPTRLPPRAATVAEPAPVPTLIAVTLAFAVLVTMNVHTVTPYSPVFGGGAKAALHRF